MYGKSLDHCSAYSYTTDFSLICGKHQSIGALSAFKVLVIVGHYKWDVSYYGRSSRRENVPVNVDEFAFC